MFSKIAGLYIGRYGESSFYSDFREMLLLKNMNLLRAEKDKEASSWIYKEPKKIRKHHLDCVLIIFLDAIMNTPVSWLYIGRYGESTFILIRRN